MKQIFVLLTLSLTAISNLFAQERKELRTGHSVFVEEYVVDSLTYWDLVHVVSPEKGCVEQDSVIVGWLQEAPKKLLTHDIIYLLKRYNDETKFCFSVRLKFDSEGNIVYILLMSSEEIYDQLTGEQVNVIFDKIRETKSPL